MDADDVLNLSPLVVWAVALSHLLTLGLTVFNLLASGSRANGKRLDDHADRLQAVESRLQHIDQAVTMLPSKADVHQLQLSLARMEGDMKAVRVEFTGARELIERMENVLNRHEDHLLKGSAR